MHSSKDQPYRENMIFNKLESCPPLIRWSAVPLPRSHFVT
jgi:hypothetical protein